MTDQEDAASTREDPLETEVNELTVNGISYIRKDSVGDVADTPSEKQIVILQRGWVMIGDFRQNDENCTLDNASVIRVFGTTKGLGQLALTGPTKTTILDPCGHVEFHELTVIARLNTKKDLWK